MRSGRLGGGRRASGFASDAKRWDRTRGGARRGRAVVDERRRDARGFRVISRMEWFRSQHEDGVSDCLTHETRV